VTNLKLIAQKRTSRKKRIFILLFIAVFVSVVLFLLTPKEQKAFFTFSAIIWTLTAILLWYILLAPFFTKALQHILHKTSDKYCIQVGEILSFIPVLNQLTIMAWRSSKNRPSWQRIPVFLKTLLGWSLTYIEPDTKP
jgi:ABC-type long-subunit fatty acid transport system fused permease/ATPase subunit